jgi:hypothetical protein
MLYILFGDSEGDAETILKAAKRQQSVTWRVPKNAQIGERVLFYLPKHGFVAHGEIASESEHQRPGIYHAIVRRVTELPTFVPLRYVREHHRTWKWATYPRSYTIIEGRTESRLDTLLELYRDHATLMEGIVSSVLVNKYERNPVARRECIRRYGDSCFVCGFSFGRVYGDQAKGYIHVHHLESIASSGGKHAVDPVRDLRPICPNCHAVAHLQTPPLTLTKLKSLVKRSR